LKAYSDIFFRTLKKELQMIKENNEIIIRT